MTVKMLYNVGVDYIAVIMVRYVKQVLKLKKLMCSLKPDSGPRWCPMAKSADIVITSANSGVASGNTVTLPGNIVRHREEKLNDRATSAKCPKRTNMFVNFGSIGVESVTRCCYGLIGYNRE